MEGCWENLSDSVDNLSFDVDKTKWTVIDFTKCRMKRLSMHWWGYCCKYICLTLYSPSKSFRWHLEHLINKIGFCNHVLITIIMLYFEELQWRAYLHCLIPMTKSFNTENESNYLIITRCCGTWYKTLNTIFFISFCNRIILLVIQLLY